MINCGALSLGYVAVAVFRLYTWVVFIGPLAAGGGERVDVRVLTAA